MNPILPLVAALYFFLSLGCTVVQPPAASTALLRSSQQIDIYILMGQSNMVGRDTSTLDTFSDNPRILMLTEDNRWVVARDPIHPKVGSIPVGVGPGLPFAREMIKNNPNVTIALVPCAVGGTPLSRWTQNADLYQNALARAKFAAKSGTIKGMLWHQGESDSDAATNANTYETRLTKMFADFRHDLALPNLPIVVGQLGEFLTPDKHPFVNTVRAALKHIPEIVPHTAYADSAGLKDKGDQLHFTAAAATEFGQRYATAMQTLLQHPN